MEGPLVAYISLVHLTRDMESLLEVADQAIADSGLTIHETEAIIGLVAQKVVG